MSNQAEVAYRIILSDFTRRLLRHGKILEVLCIVRAKYSQYRGFEKRKLSPAMSIEAGATLFVGDRSEDQGAARNAGAYFEK